MTIRHGRSFKISRASPRRTARLEDPILRAPIQIVAACSLVLLALAGCDEVSETQPRQTFPPPAGLIGYTANQDDYGDVTIYLVSPDGTGLRALANGIGAADGIEWSPDGNLLSVSSFVGPSQEGVLETLSVENGASRRVAGGFDLPSQPVWSPDGRRLAFSEDIQYRGQCGLIACNPEIYAISSDGENLTRLTFRDRWWDTHPDWSSDSEWVAFSSGIPTFEPTEFWAVRADGSGLTQLTDSKPHGYPEWRPHTNQVSYLDDVGCALSSPEPCSLELFLIDVPGGTPQRLSPERMEISSVGGFEWSPDGSRLAFVSDRDGLTGLYLWGADGETTVFVDHNFEADAFDSITWSPDGHHLAFRGTRYGRGTDIVWVVAEDGSSLRVIAEADILEGPVWSPVD